MPQMPDKAAVFDDALSFYRYLAISRRDRDWGLFVTGTGHEVMTADAQAAGRESLYTVEQNGDRHSVRWDPSYPQPYRYDWHRGRKFVDEFGILYIDSGAPWLFESDATSGEIVVPPGSVLLIFPEVWHRYRPQLAHEAHFTSTLWCTFGGDGARRWQQRGLISPTEPVLIVGSDPALAQGFRRLHQQVHAADPLAAQRAMTGSLWELLGAADAATRRATPMLSDDVVQRARTMLEDLAAPGVSPKEVARVLRLPYDQFRRWFKVTTGLSPHQYRLQMVIRRAKELLEATDMSVKQIAAVLHFTDQYYFAKAFKRKTGRTPSDWRSRARNAR
jgi:AraC-like DNA-binding protein